MWMFVEAFISLAGRCVAVLDALWQPVVAWLVSLCDVLSADSPGAVAAPEFGTTGAADPQVGFCRPVLLTGLAAHPLTR